MRIPPEWPHYLSVSPPLLWDLLLAQILEELLILPEIWALDFLLQWLLARSRSPEFQVLQIRWAICGPLSSDRLLEGLVPRSFICSWSWRTGPKIERREFIPEMMKMNLIQKKIICDFYTEINYTK